MPTIIAKNTTWTAGRAYNLTDDLQIADGATLTIEAGAVVNGNGHRIQTFGKLVAAGVAGNSIAFNNTEFTFSSNYSDPGEIEMYFSVLSGSTFLPATGNASYGKFKIADSTISGGEMMYVWYPIGDSVFERNVFVNAGVISVGSDVNSQVSIIDNTFYSHRENAAVDDWAAYGKPLLVSGNNFYVAGVAIESKLGYDAVKILASNNYFGASTLSQISAKILDHLDDLQRSATVDVSAQRLIASSVAPILPSTEFAEMMTANILRQENNTVAYNSVLSVVKNAASQGFALDSVLKLADATTSVATLSYQFFTGKVPSQAGVDFLVSPTGPNTTNLNSAYYAKFDTVNRYINFAVNLGKNGEAKDSFAAKYGALSLFDATKEAYKTIFGGTPTDAKVHALIDTRVDYLAYYGGDGATGIGTKAAMVGFLLAAAATEDVGMYAKASNAFLADLSDGTIFAVDLVGVYGKAEYSYAG